MKLRYLLILLFIISFTGLHAQNGSHGDVIYRAKNVHAGNLVRVTFHNSGRLGGVKGDQSVTYGGEWPIGTGMIQMGNTSAYVMTEMRLFAGLDPETGDSLYEYITPAVFCEGWDPDVFSHDSLGRFQGFEPVPGYLNLTQKESAPDNAVAMSHQPYTWPAYWPDKLADTRDPGWSGNWNGYFGKDQKNADEESYYVMDDYQYDKKLKGLRLPKPMPDDEPMRAGLGLRVAVRGLQWSNPDAEDCIFWLYEIKNFGQTYLDKTLFGLNVGASSGATVTQNTDYQDDGAKFYRDRSLAVNFDEDNLGTGGYTPVPWVGFAFLESPGNPYDGIDNDADGGDINKPGGGTGHIITLDDFVHVYGVNDDVVLINYRSDNYDRTLTQMPAEGFTFYHNGEKIVRKPNTPLIEIPRNGFDDNLNGLIDESDGAFTQDSVEFYLYIRSESNDKDYLAKDYFTNDGIDNLLIDERRDDLIDNDADWDSEFDDVGIDGKPGTGDSGEGDGIPTPGYGDLPGEPNVDQVDVDESDQIGLTSFKFYRYSTLTYSNDDQMWEFSRPGYFDNTTTEVADHDYVFTSGYFPLRPEKEEFFSIAMIYGWDETDIIRNKDVVQKIYNSNYNFAIAPVKPKVTAVAGDGQVTLYWDDGAEKSFDRFLKEYDFEGYKIYKATHHTFGDAGTITDGFGYARFKQPLEIYDKVDDIFGFFPKDFGTGVLFNLGNETGLVHKFVDNDVQNGIRYYYAVTAYDRGNLEKNIGPSETTIFLNVDQSGNIQLSDNVVAVIPQAPALGYEPADFDLAPRLIGNGLTSGMVGVNIIDPNVLADGDKYEIHFIDQSMDKRDNDLDGIFDLDDPDELLPIVTTGFVLKNVTQGTSMDTVWIKDYRGSSDSLVLIQDLYADRDGDPRTFTSIQNGMEIFVYNPDFGLINKPELGIFNGVQWSKNINPLTAYSIDFKKFENGPAFVEGTPYPRQYEIVFFDEIVDTSDVVKLPFKNGNFYPLPAKPVNFKVYDKVSGEELPFAVASEISVDKNLTPAGFFSAKDRIVLFENLSNGTTLITYDILNNDVQDTSFYNAYGRILGAGDTLRVYPEIPFNHNMAFEYQIKGQKVNAEEAKENLDMIKVVPNPYVVTALWEPHNPYTTGRGPRAIQFIHLPQKCTIRVYAVDGTLVQTLYHDSPMRDGSETWDMMTMDNMDIAYGVYIYHVDAPGIGERVGRILIIK